MPGNKKNTTGINYLSILGAHNKVPQVNEEISRWNLIVMGAKGLVSGKALM